MFKKILNPDQNADNIIKLNAGETGCCGDMSNACQSSIDYPKSQALVSISVKEGATTKNISVPVPANSTSAALALVVRNALLASGYEQDEESTEKSVSVITGGTNHTLTIVGDVEVVNLVHASGTVTTIAKKCAKKMLCTASLFAYAGGAAGAAATDMQVNGTKTNLGAIVGGTTTAAAVKTAVEGALAAGMVTGAVVTVTGTTTYDITIANAERNDTLKLNGVYLAKTGCAVLWV